MPFLEKLSKEQQDILVALPYRTGLWVSLSDDSGGNESDEAELSALENIVCGFAEDFCKSEVTEELMHETVSRRNEWTEWRRNIKNVPAECAEAVKWVAQHADYKNVSAFKENLMEIAFAVALAYREFDDDVSFADKLDMYGRFAWDRVTSFVFKRAPKTHDEIFNISRAERLALTELAQALNRAQKEGQEVVDIYADENIDPNIGKKIRFEDTDVQL